MDYFTDNNELIQWNLLYGVSILLLSVALILMVAIYIRQCRIIKRLKAENERKLLEHKILEEELKTSKEQEKIRNVQNSELLRYALIHSTSTDISELIEFFTDASRGKRKVSEDDWSRLFKTVDSAYPDFRNSIVENVARISIPLLRTCYLVKIGMSNPQISNIMDTPPQTVWYRVDKLKKLMGDVLNKI